MYATDANGCQVNTDDSLGAYIANNTPVTVEYTSTTAVCSNNNGTATILAYGGTAPYTYYWNTTPVQTTVTATNLAEGQYQVRVTDATGCAGRGIVYVSSSSGTLQATAVVTNETCGDASGSIILLTSGGTTPYTYLWDDASTTSTLTGLSEGGHSVRISDNGGCVFNKYLFVDNDSPVKVSFTTTSAACDHTGGAVTAIPAGGVAPYTYSWGWSNSSTSASLSNISEGYYTVFVEDDNGCQATNWVHVNIDAACFNLVSGKLFQDNNSNCVEDAGDYPISNSYIINNISGASAYNSYAITDQQGQYTMSSVSGNYTVAPLYTNPNYTVSCPASGNYTISANTGQQTFSNNDFAFQPINQVNDVSAYGYGVGPRPGFQYYYTLYIQNNGTSPASGTVTFTHDAVGQFLSTSPAGDSYNAGTSEIEFHYTNLGIGEIQYMNVYMQLPVGTPLGTVLNATLSATNAAGDDVPNNNLSHFQTTVTGSFDPNDIAVSPTGVGSPGYITRQDDVLTYHIRFQNTGTAEAYFIKVVDELDADLNPLSVHDVVASHAYTLTVKNGNVLEFFFPDIMLPDSTTDLEGSNGFITYKVNLIPNLPLGTEITNEAAIYFDYNEPVLTNTVLNTLTTTAPVVDPTAAAARHKAYPVPAHDQLVIQADVNFEYVEVMDLTGRVVKTSTAPGNTAEVNVNDLAPGVYVYKIYVDGEAPMTGKVVVE